MKYINILFLILGFAYSIVAQSNDDIDLSSFPKNFHSGELSAPVDCENMKFLKNGTFIYKFTGDCKGWGRKLKGIWKKREDHLELSGIMYENYQEGKIGCAGSYYHTNTRDEREECIKEYIKRTLNYNLVVFL